MMVIGILLSFGLIVILGWIIAGSFFSHRHWRKVIAAGDAPTLVAALEEALYTWRTLRPPREVPPADWAGLQSAAIVACDLHRCRLSLIAPPDVRVIDGQREQVGSAETVAERIAVKMVERALFEIPLCRFDAVQIDVYAEYRSPDGHVETDCLLTTRTTREEANNAPWDEATETEILNGWRTRRMTGGQPVDPDLGALIDVHEHALPREDDEQRLEPPEERAAG